MCNDYGVDIPFSLFALAFSEVGLPLVIPRDIPNLEPRDEIWPTDRGPVVRAAPEGVILEELRWGLRPGRPNGPPLINLRGEGRAWTSGRCLVPASHFYEFTGSKSPKTRWRFTSSESDWFCIAGVIGLGQSQGQDVAAFAMLTLPPGPDVAPIHNRQPAVLARADWTAWLDPEVPAEDLLRPSPAGTLRVSEAPRAKISQ